jgi:hypothetical protein
MLLGNSAGPDYAASLSDRLSRAELMTRQEKRKLISEADIARAFNNLMSETGAPDSLRADDAAVKAGRAAFEKEMPALISQQRNGTYCNPGEAVFIVSMLIENIGRSATPSSQSDHNAHVSSGHPAPVRTHLALFCANHSRSDVTKLFNRLFNVFLI